ncbi:MAG: ThiF family adenylyltransferase [Spirochaetes bacterium]|nr:ThiF family adenylyltransferase [Spirochaetota bacterium]MBU1079254.1 ThiF family adenylyltransferase [Spirochaetota bacterium]
MRTETRYQRQLAFSGIGPAGQERLARARATVIGVGALGTAIANSLARAGFGFIRLVDPDRVEESNLQRQMLFDEDDAAAGVLKAEAAAARLQRVNSGVSIEPIAARADASNIDALVGDVDVTLDGTDNFEARYLVNDACARLGRPWVYGGVLADSGVSMNIVPGGPCLRCLIPEPPPAGSFATPETAGVLNQITAIIGSIEAVEAMKIVLGSPDVRRSLLSISLWDAQFNAIDVQRNPECPTCGRLEHPFILFPT